MELKPGLYLQWIVLFLVVSLPCAAQPTDAVTVGKTDTLHSNILGETRPLYIGLPASYEHDDFYLQKNYPVLVLLDADTHFRYAAGMVRHLASEENELIPELIVVGVRNTDRTRDMTSNLTGKSDKFRDFLEQELLPYISRRYRTAPYYVLAGHSLAGLFTVNCLLDEGRFKAYIAIDPTLSWNNNYLVKKADSLFSGKPVQPARLYLSQAANPFDPDQHAGTRGKAFDAFKVALGGGGAGQVAHRYAFYDQETHFSVPFRSLYDALLFVFDGYAFPFQTFLKEGSKGLDRHYQQVITRLGVDISPPGKVINQAGLYLLQHPTDAKKGVDLLRLNARYYPNAPAVQRSLAKANTYFSRTHAE